eukprot:Pgem_evm1s1569
MVSTPATATALTTTKLSRDTTSAITDLANNNQVNDTNAIDTPDTPATTDLATPKLTNEATTVT